MRSILALLSLLVFFSQARAADPIKVVFFNYPPHVVVDANGKPSGPTIDVWEKFIAPAANVSIEWIGPVPFPRAMVMLKAGEADAISLIAKNPERDATFLFPATPHIEGKQGILVNKSEPLDAVTDAQQLSGKTIGKLGAGYIPPFFEQNKDKLTFAEINGDDAAKLNVQKLLAGHIWGAYFIFVDTLQYHAAVMKSLDKVKVVSFPGSDVNEVAYPAMSRKLDPAIAARISAAVTAVRPKYDYVKMTNDALAAIN